MTSNQRFTLPWEEGNWDEEIANWIDAQLIAHNVPATGPIEVIHKRLWSAMAKVETEKGLLYFKALAPNFVFEVPLSIALEQWQPQHSLRLLSSDADRGWMLSWNAGDSLRMLTRRPDQLEHWYKLLPQYSQFQLDLAQHTEQLLAWGAPDRRLENLPQQLEQLLADTDQLQIGAEDGLTAADYQSLLGKLPQFREQCAELASYGLPNTLVSEELHENNVLFDGQRYTFIDWSDASVGNPLFTLVVTLRASAYWLKLDEKGPELRKMRDAYLEPFTSFASRAQLDKAADIAIHVGMANRALSWSRAISVMSDKHRAENLDAVPGWLKDYLDESR
jgi:hypothetical protein